MSDVQLILREDVVNLGEAGDLVRVKRGYARNFLVPQGKAELATKSNIRQLEHQQRVISEKLAKELKDVEAVARKVRGMVVEVEANAGPEGKLFGSVTAAQNIVTAVNRSGLEVADTVLEPIAAGEATLSEDEKELGCVLLDIGGGKTNLAIYHHGAVRHTVVLPIGSDHFTNDIAVGLRTPIPEAERLKREFGCALASMADQDVTFDFVGVGSRKTRTIGQRVLSDVLQPRAEEIIHFVHDEIRGAGYERQAGAGAILTGGGAVLRGIPELVEEFLDLPVRLGVTQGFSDARFVEPEYATVVGLVVFGDRRRRTHEFHEHSGSTFKRMVSKLRGLGLF